MELNPVPNQIEPRWLLCSVDSQITLVHFFTREIETTSWALMAFKIHSTHSRKKEKKQSLHTERNSLSHQCLCVWEHSGSFPDKLQDKMATSAAVCRSEMTSHTAKALLTMPLTSLLQQPATRAVNVVESEQTHLIWTRTVRSMKSDSRGSRLELDSHLAWTQAQVSSSSITINYSHLPFIFPQYLLFISQPITIHSIYEKSQAGLSDQKKRQSDIQHRGWFNFNSSVLPVIRQLKVREMNRLSHHRGSKDSLIHFLLLIYWARVHGRDLGRICVIGAAERNSFCRRLYLSQRRDGSEGLWFSFWCLFFLLLSSATHC